MKYTNTAYIYIDGANLHRGIKSLGWSLDYEKFYYMLKERYKADRIFLFVGYLEKMGKLYEALSRIGYELIFKETLILKDSEVKGNCDTNIVVEALKNYYEDNSTLNILVSGDGDFVCLINFLASRAAFDRILAPARSQCSLLLLRTGQKVSFIEEFRPLLEKDACRG